MKGGQVYLINDIKTTTLYNNKQINNIKTADGLAFIETTFGIRSLPWVGKSRWPPSHNSALEFTIKNLPLAPGDYSCNIYSEINNEVADWLTEVMDFSIAEKDYYQSGKLVPRNQGSILLNYNIK